MSQSVLTKLSRRGLIVGIGGVLGATAIRSASASEGLAVIVNPTNKDVPSLADLAAMFTTRKQSWEGGKRIVPFNFPAKHAVRVAFDRAVLEMDPDEVARYWIDRRIRGGNAPPKQVASAQLIVRLVEKLDGAIGYVPQSAVSSGVRLVRTI